MKKLPNENGQVLVLTAICMTCLMGFLAFAADVGLLLVARRAVQSAADSAAIAGASQVNYVAVDGMTVAAAANAAAALNGLTNGSNGVAITVNNAPLSGPHVGNTSYVEVIIQRNVPTFFMRIFGRNAVTVSGRAVAGFGGSQGCIFALGATGTDITLVGGATLSVPGCQIFDDSSDIQAMSLSGGSTITAKSVGIVGGYYEQSPNSITPNPITGLIPVSDPLAYLQDPPISGCAATKNLSGNSAHYLTPGCYNGIALVGGGDLNLSPGLYVVNGNLTLNGSGNVNGTDVTFFINGQTKISSGVLKLSAPTTGQYNSILFYQSRSDTQGVALTGSSGSEMHGIVYAPAAPLTYNGSSNAKLYSSFVAQTVTFVGSTSFNNYALINGSSPLATAELVE